MLISCCIIAKNEDETLEKCLSSVFCFADEIIFVDTGSTDKTIEIANTYTNNIYNYQWIDDFSKARNYAISLAHGDWIVFPDADEYIETKCDWLKEYLQNTDKDALLCSIYEKNQKSDTISSDRNVVRVFKNEPNIRYTRSIHEYLIKNDGYIDIADCRNDIKIFHSGYTDKAMHGKNKYHRNITMLLSELKKNPTDSELNFFIADMYRISNDWLKAMFHIELAIKYDNFRTQIIKNQTYILKNDLLNKNRTNY